MFLEGIRNTLLHITHVDGPRYEYWNDTSIPDWDICVICYRRHGCHAFGSVKMYIQMIHQRRLYPALQRLMHGPAP